MLLSNGNGNTFLHMLELDFRRGILRVTCLLSFERLAFKPNTGSSAYLCHLFFSERHTDTKMRLDWIRDEDLVKPFHIKMGMIEFLRYLFIYNTLFIWREKNAQVCTTRLPIWSTCLEFNQQPFLIQSHCEPGDIYTLKHLVLPGLISSSPIILIFSQGHSMAM